MKAFSKKNILVCLSIAALIALVAVIILQGVRIANVERAQQQQEETSEVLDKRVKETTYNPHSLNECLNRAANDYTNFIRQNGEVIPEKDGENSYSLSESQWKTADAKLELERQNCKTLFGTE